MKETKRLYLALLVLAAGFFWCMCAGRFWPAPGGGGSGKGGAGGRARSRGRRSGRDWDAFLELQCAAARGRWGTQIGAHYRDKRPTGGGLPTRCAGDGVDDAVRCPQHGNLCCV